MCVIACACVKDALTVAYARLWGLPIHLDRACLDLLDLPMSERLGQSCDLEIERAITVHVEGELSGCALRKHAVTSSF